MIGATERLRSDRHCLRETIEAGRAIGLGEIRRPASSSDRHGRCSIGQPYEQLAAYYRRIGHEDDARTVLLARHRHRRNARRLPARLWEYIEDLAVGYGYRPGRALAWLCGFTALVALTFSAEPPRALRSDGPDFQPVAYALDLILPILDLGQERAFTPVGPARWVAWAAVLAGWLLATTVIAGITRRVNRM